MTIGAPARTRSPIIARDEEPPVARLRRALALSRDSDPEPGFAALRNLAAAYPAWDEPLLRLAQGLRQAGDVAAAAAAYDAVLEINPGRPEALLGLAALLMQRGEAVRAQSLLIRCCGIVPGQAEAWDALGISLLMTDDAPTAESAFAEAQRLAPLMVDYALHRAEAALAAGSAEAELARLELASGDDPLNVASLCARGLLLDRLGRRAEAADILEAAAALAPDAVAPAVLLGRALAALSRPREAEAALARAIELDPGNPQPRNDRAVMLIRMQRYAEARDVLQGLIETHGREPAALCNLANATVALGDQTEAVRLAEEAVALAPGAVLPWRTLCNTLPYRAGIGGDELLHVLRQCARRLPRAPAPRWTCRPDPDRRLRIGLLSGSLKTHPVGWLTVAGFEALDPAGFEIVCLAQDGADDPLARRFRALASGWHEVSGLDDPSLAALARELAIDVLIELGGYGEAGRMPACAFRLAPVQVKWVGMQNHGTGLPEMDWFLTDRWETPEGSERFYDERLLRLPDGYVCYSPPAHAPDVAPLPALANGFVTFGCFNNLAKITPSVIAAWARILRDLPTARMVLKTHQFADAATRDRVHARFAEAGHRALAHRVARGVGTPAVPRGIQPCRSGARSLPVFRRAHDVRGAVDGRPHAHPSGGDLRIAPQREPHVQCRARRLVGRGRRRLCGTRRAQGRRYRRARGVADGPAALGASEPALRRAAVRPWPGRRPAPRVAGLVHPADRRPPMNAGRATRTTGAYARLGAAG